MQTSPFIVGVDYKAIFLSPQTEREQDPDDILDIEPSRGISITSRSSRLNPKRQASQSVYRYSDDDSYLPPIFDDEQPDPNPTLPLLAFFEDDADSMNSTGNTGTVSKDQGDFQLFKPSTNADACSYDLRDQQEPPTVSKEYPNYGSSKDNTNSSDLYDVDTKKDIKSQLEAEPGPLCFQSVSPTPDSPSRLDTELHIQHHHPDTKKPASSVTASPKDIKPTLPANLTINAAAAKSNSKKKAPSSTTSSSAGSTSGIPVDPALAGSSSSNSMQQSQSALSSYFDVSGMSNINNNGVNARPMQRAGQPSFLKDMGDGMIRTPGPGQMVSPTQTFMEPSSALQNTASNTASRPQVSESGPGWPTDAQLRAMVASIHKAHDEQQAQRKQQQQQAQQTINNQNNVQQQQQVPYPFPNTFQVKPEALNTSTDIAVPSSSSINNNTASNPLPPLPTNYQPPPAPLNFQDGSFFSHQAILASLQAENDARLMSAMGQGNFGGFNAASYMPAFASTSTAGDVNVAQHFNQQQQASTSALSTPGNNTSDSSRKRGRGGNSKARQQQQQDNQRQGLTRENSGSQQAPSSVRSTYDNNGDEPNPFHTDASAFFNLDGNDLGLDINAANNYNDQMQAAGIPIPQSSRTSSSRAAKKKSQQGADMGDFPVVGTSKANNVQGSGATRSGAADEDPLHDSSFSTEEDDEWVAEDSDDSFGKPAKKKGKKLGAAWTPSTASTSNATKATKTKKSKKDINNNTTNTNSSSTATAVPPLPPSSYSGFNFAPQFGADGMYIMPPALDHTPQQSPVQTSAKSENGHSERNKPAAPGTGSIVCDYVDPATGYVCQVRFRRPYDQARHLETVHGVGNDAKPKSVCFTCHKSFSRKDALIRHGRISGHVTFQPREPTPD